MLTKNLVNDKSLPPEIEKLTAEEENTVAEGCGLPTRLYQLNKESVPVESRYDKSQVSYDAVATENIDEDQPVETGCTSEGKQLASAD